MNYYYYYYNYFYLLSTKFPSLKYWRLSN